MTTEPDIYDPNRQMTVICHADEIPQTFASEAEEQAWWSTHELSEELWARHASVPDEDLPPVRGDGASSPAIPNAHLQR